MNIMQATRNTVGDLLRRTARKYPERTAVIFRETSLTYRALDEKVNQLANALLALGVRKGDRVAINAYNSHYYVINWFALARIGAIQVPINYMLKGQEIAYIINHSAPRVFFVEDTLLDVVREVQNQLGSVEHWISLRVSGRDTPEGWLDFDHLLADQPTDEPEVELFESEVAQISYTSGTESLPKGAMLTHQGLISQYASCIIEGEYSGRDVVLHSLPLYHCAQMHVFLTPYIQLGAKNVILWKADPTEILRTIENERITSIFLPPTVWIGLLRHPQFDTFDLSSLEKGYYGASIMPVEVLKELAARLPRVRLWNYYGQTEMSPAATVLKPEDQLRKPGSCGRPLLNVETRLVDDNDNDVPVGEIGEIVHRSSHLMIGYYKDEERTQAAFRSGWFHSGDLARMDEEGYLYIVDRKKDMIKTGGENVSSRDVEEAIYRHPRVAEVAVIGLPDPVWIEAVTAVVVPKAGQNITEGEIIEHCRQHLARFKVPKRVIITDHLPKNPSGKILKRFLRDQYR